MTNNDIRIEWYVVCPHCFYEYCARNTSLANYNCHTCGNSFQTSPYFRSKSCSKKALPHS